MLVLLINLNTFVKGLAIPKKIDVVGNEKLRSFFLNFYMTDQHDKQVMVVEICFFPRLLVGSCIQLHQSVLSV